MDNTTEQFAESPAPTTEKSPFNESRTLSRNRVIAEGFRNHTKGEALFNKISYIGFGYVLTTAVSVAMTWLLNDRYAESFDRFKNGVRNSKYLEFAKLKNVRQDKFDSAMEIGTLFLGGTIASVLPVKWLEDHKAKLVEKFDHLYYSDQEIANNPMFDQAYKTLKAEPGQTWLSVISSRLVAFIATFSVFGLMGSNTTPLKKATGESIDSLSIKAGRAIDGALSGKGATAQIAEAISTNKNAIAATSHLPAKDVNRVNGFQAIRNTTYGTPDRVASRVWNYIVKDGFYTIITSASLFIFTRLLGPVFGKSNNPAPTEPAVTKPDAVAPVAPAPVSEPAQAKEAPTHSVSQTTHQLRVSAAPAAQEITA